MYHPSTTWFWYRRTDAVRPGSLYKNLETDLDFATLSTLLSHERRATDLVLGAAEIIVPGWIDDLRRDMEESGFPPTSRSGIATQALAMRGWDAKSHTEDKHDPMITGSVSFGRASDTATPESGFAFPTVHGENGLALESGSGTFFFFSAKTYPHGTTHAATPQNQPAAAATSVASVTDLVERGILSMELASESETLAQEDNPETVTLSPQRIKVRISQSEPLLQCSLFCLHRASPTSRPRRGSRRRSQTDSAATWLRATCLLGFASSPRSTPLHLRGSATLILSKSLPALKASGTVVGSEPLHAHPYT